MGDLSPAETSRLAKLQRDASEGSAELDPDLCHLQLQAVRQPYRRSLRALERITGTSKSTLSRNERGEQQFSLHAAIRYLRYCGYSIRIEKKP